MVFVQECFWVAHPFGGHAGLLVLWNQSTSCAQPRTRRRKQQALRKRMRQMRPLKVQRPQRVQASCLQAVHSSDSRFFLCGFTSLEKTCIGLLVEVWSARESGGPKRLPARCKNSIDRPSQRIRRILSLQLNHLPLIHPSDILHPISTCPHYFMSLKEGVVLKTRYQPRVRDSVGAQRRLTLDHSALTWIAIRSILQLTRMNLCRRLLMEGSHFPQR